MCLIYMEIGLRSHEPILLCPKMKPAKKIDSTLLQAQGLGTNFSEILIENAFEIVVCEKAILSRPQCINKLNYW